MVRALPYEQNYIQFIVYRVLIFLFTPRVNAEAVAPEIKIINYL